MKLFAAGFLSCYLLGALPVGIITARLNKSASSILFHALVWPNVMMRVADAAIIDKTK
jgi:hypothetical protein